MSEIFTHEGVNYRKKFRKALGGDMVVIIDVKDLNGDGYNLGDIFKIGSRWSNGAETVDGITLYDEEYVVLVADEGAVSTKDAVNSPQHYTQGAVEVIDYIDQVADGYEGKQAYYVGNIVKYVSRAPHKNGLEDLRKASWYLTRLIDGIETRAKSNV